MIKEAIVKIVNKGDLSYDEAYAVMNEIMSGETTPTQNAAFLAALSTKSARAETTDEIAGCAAAMRDHATKVDTGMDIFEIVGTGGLVIARDVEIGKVPRDDALGGRGLFHLADEGQIIFFERVVKARAVRAALFAAHRL